MIDGSEEMKKLRKNYIEAMKDRFDDRYKPSKDNLFKLIVNGSK